MLKDCATVGIGNAQIEGVHYDKEALPSDWYIQYKSLTADSSNKLVKRMYLSDDCVKIMPNSSTIPRLIALPEKHVLLVEKEPIPVSGRRSFYRHIPIPEEPSSSTNTTLSTNQMYIPEEKSFLVVNKMFRAYVNTFPPVEKFQYANRRFVKGGNWPPKTKFCTSSSISI